MAKTAVSDEEIQLRKRARRRLVGAVALVLVAVVVLPWVLDNEPKQRPQEVNIQIPPIPSQTPAMPAGAGAQTATPAPAVSDAAQPRSAPRPPQPALSPPAEKPGAAPQASDLTAQPGPVPKPAAPSSPASGQRAPGAPKAAVTPNAAPGASGKPGAASPNGSVQGQAGEGYVIRLGAFSDPGNAKQLLAKLKANKIAGYSESVKTPQGQRVRVRAGPFPTQESAQSARDRLRQLKLIPPPSEGKIVRQGE